MHRTQIQLEEWQYEALVREAESAGTSLAQLVRTAVSQYLEGQRRAPGSRELSRIAGIAEDAGATGRDHDRLLYGGRRPPGESDGDGNGGG